MKINQIVNESTTSGSIATVAQPLRGIEKRPQLVGLKSAGTKSKKTGPYANSLTESKVKELVMDLKNNKDGLNDADFKKKYGKSKEEMRKSMQKPNKPVKEAKLDEDDLIIVPGQGIRRKTGFVPHSQSRVDHEVEMAKSDLLQLLKNTKAVMTLVKDRSEEEGLEGWVQEKIIKAADYMNTIAEYLEGKRLQEISGGVIAGGGVGEGLGGKIVGGIVGGAATRSLGGASVGSEIGSAVQDMFTPEGAKVDRMVKHVAQSEKKLGHSKKEAENIAWATANKRGMLDNKNKKK